MFKPAFALIALLPLLGCAESPAPAAPAVKSAKPAPAAKPKKAVVAVPAAKPAQPPVVDSQKVIGREAGELVAHFGAPESVSDEPPATVWRYTVTGCRLDVFLYPNVETRELRALSFKVDGPAPACQASADAAPR